MKTTPKIVVRRRVRPIRLGFLVDAQSPEQILAAIQANTIAWGGRYNPIIPVFGRTPRAWRTPRTAHDIVRGMLAAFEPDFVVVPDGIDAARFGVPPAHVLNLARISTLEGYGECGLGVMPVYQRLYKEEVSVVRKKPQRFVLPRFKKASWSSFAAACFGSYPAGPLDFVAKGFDDLGGVREEVDEQTFLDVPARALSPLQMGSLWLEERGIAGPWRTFFVLDPTKPLDLTDFWNLRALGWRIRPIPIQAASRLRDHVSSVVRNEHASSGGFLSGMREATLLKARSVRASAFEEFITALRPPEGAVVQTWMPGIELPEARAFPRGARVERVEVSAKIEEVDATVEADRISFPVLVPDVLVRPV